jgi:hypothetical protein
VKPRPSQRLDSPFISIFDEEFGLWCELVILLWRCDPHLSEEFVSIIHFFDFANEVSEGLIRSASQI